MTTISESSAIDPAARITCSSSERFIDPLALFCRQDPCERGRLWNSRHARYSPSTAMISRRIGYRAATGTCRCRSSDNAPMHTELHKLISAPDGYAALHAATTGDTACLAKSPPGAYYSRLSLV